MADDIVTRLWQYTPEVANPSMETRLLLDDAAHEIERLRDKQQDLQMYAEQDACEIERLKTEVKRLGAEIAVEWYNAVLVDRPDGAWTLYAADGLTLDCYDGPEDRKEVRRG
jgi:hypothetical protein